MSRFAYEPNEKLIRGHVPQIRTARDLLQELGVETADATSQANEVEHWLQTHDYDELLTASLANHGLPTKGRTVVHVSGGVTVYHEPGQPVFVVYAPIKEREWNYLGEASPNAKQQRQPVLA